MNETYIMPDYEIVRNAERCVRCMACVRLCANGAHIFDEKRGVLTADDSKCVNCHYCVANCPTCTYTVRAISYTKPDSSMQHENVSTRSRS